MTRPRTQAREVALQVLYQLDIRDDQSAEELLAEVSQEVSGHDAQELARTLVEGTRANLAAIDAEVEGVAHNWEMKRMAAIDRNILRLGTYELLFRPDLPAPVSINEAVQLAKKFSTKESGGFVNGILDKVHQRHLDPAADGGA